MNLVLMGGICTGTIAALGVVLVALAILRNANPEARVHAFIVKTGTAPRGASVHEEDGWVYWLVENKDVYRARVEHVSRNAPQPIWETVERQNSPFALKGTVVTFEVVRVSECERRQAAADEQFDI